MMLRLYVLISICVVLLCCEQGWCDKPAPPAKRENALLLPALTSRNSEVERSAIEVLITGGLESSGIHVLNRRERVARCPEKNDGLDRARSQYLDLEMTAALELAEKVRSGQLAAFGDLLGCPDLREAELFMVQIFLDIGEREKAFKLAVEILEREANIRLDPAKFTPAVLALWSEAAKRVSQGAFREVNLERLARLATQADVDWVVIGVCWKCGVDGDPLRILAVPAGTPENTYSGQVTLGTESQWSLRVRENLAGPFPPPVPPSQAVVRPTQFPVGQEPEVARKKPWYKTWWFWTVVGAVVVGGTAGAIGGYYANTNDKSTGLEAEFNW